MWRRNTGRESSHISFFCGVRGTHSGELTGLLEWLADLLLRLRDQRISPFAWASSGSLPSVQNYRPQIVFSSPMRKYEHPLRITYFLFMAGYRNLHTSVFPVICWSYLRTEIFVILSTSDKLHFSLSCETTLLILSCDRMESAKFIHGTPSTPPQ